jgi:hypothetical protein
MTDLSKTIIPKSDQLNADDLIVNSKLITIKSVKVTDGEQCVSIGYDGDEGKPWKPCKSMRRVLIECWGANGDNYIGRQAVLYRDPTVKWAGVDYGGIRISQLSHINEQKTLMITVSRGKRVPFIIKPIITEPLNELTDEKFEEYKTLIEAAQSVKELAPIAAQIKLARYTAEGAAKIRVEYDAALKRIRESTEAK